MGEESPWELQSMQQEKVVEEQKHEINSVLSTT